jgi:hypothetical protein
MSLFVFRRKERPNLPGARDACGFIIPDVARVASLDPAGGPEPRALAGGPVARLAGRDGTRLVEARHPRVLAHRPQDLGRGERGAVGR